MKFKKTVFLISITFLLFSCNTRLTPLSAQNTELVSVNEVPSNYEPSENEKIDKNSEETNTSTSSESTSSANSTKSSQTPIENKKTQQSEKLNPTQTKPNVFEQIKTKAAALIEVADLVIRHESEKLGTACNHYLQRVLTIMGFPDRDFLAHDFPEYAKKYFKTYRAEKFANDNQGSDRERLKKYIWSFPERTAFIFQWSRSVLSPHGHIALVERQGEQLVIYQSSLNRFTPRKDKTTVDRLLSGWSRRQLTVFSDIE